MSTSFSHFWYLEQTKLAESINQYLYYLRKIPFVGKKIPLSLYRFYGLKHVLFVLLFVLNTVFSFSMKFVWLSIYYIAASALLNTNDSLFSYILQFHNESLYLGLLFWTVAVCLWKNFNSYFFYGLSSKEARFVQYFFIPRNHFVKQSVLLNITLEMIYYFPAFLLLSILTETFFLLILPVFLYTSFALFYTWLSRFAFSRQWKNWKKFWFILFLFLIGSATAVAGFYQRADFLLQSLSYYLLVILSLITIVGSLLAISRYSEESEYVLSLFEKNLLSEKAIQEVKNIDSHTADGISMREKLTLNQSKDFSHLQGQAFLNALLFYRYHSILKKSLLFRAGVLSFIGAIAVILSFFNVFEGVQQSAMTSIFPTLFFVLYISSMGKKIVQLVFVNCDISMLHYPFYREKNTILKGFNDRFKRSLAYNGIITSVIFFIFILIGLLNPSLLDRSFYMVLSLLLISLTVFFSFHELFIYYLLQPFNSDMEAVNPVYRFVSASLYWIAYISLQLELTGFAYALSVSIFSLLYVAIGYFVILKKAPQTFRMKH